jgi:hypothetical protein
MFDNKKTRKMDFDNLVEWFNYFPVAPGWHPHVEGLVIVVGCFVAIHHVDQVAMLMKDNKVVWTVKFPNDWLHGV